MKSINWTRWFPFLAWKRPDSALLRAGIERILADAGLSILMVEQNARQALNIADKGYVLVQGANRYTDTGANLLADPDVRRSFLGG